MITYNHRWILLCALIMILPSSGVYAAEKLNSRTLCPASGNKGQIILLIDTTDPLTPVAQERLKQLLTGIGDSENNLYLKPAHELFAYHLTPLIADMEKPILRVCNPGNPKDIIGFTDSKVKAKLRWLIFKRKIRSIFPSTPAAGEQSPLLEAIALVTARHVPSLGVVDQRKPTRLILFSDMLQNSKYLSHYKSLPTPKAFEKLTGYAEMSSNLKGVDVWLFYVRRTRDKNIQTPEHYYWWTQVIDLFAGRLMEQTPL